jgi:Heparinase II/III-like protein
MTGDEGEDGADFGTEPTYPTQHPRIYLTPHRARLSAALAQGTPAASRFRTKVDQWLGGADLWGFQAWNGALLSQLTGNAAYCKKSVAEVEAQVALAEAAIAAKRPPVVASDSYLQIGELVGDLALVYDWCYSHVSSSQRTRWIAYGNQAVWNVWNFSQAKWGGTVMPWSGWSTNNPSNNYYYSFLRATMLLGLATKGENPQADAWLVKFRDEKILGQLVPTFERDLVGGASREGTGYGVSMRRLYELYLFWQATTGENLATRTGHTHASLLAFMHQTVPTLDRVAPTGDHARDVTATFFDYHRDYLQELMAIFPGSAHAQRAKALLDSSNVPAMTSAFMVAYDFINDHTGLPGQSLDGLNTAYHASGIGELYARSGWDKGATWINLIAGPYTESHAHQDQGSLMIYKGGWLVYDANVQSRSGLSQKAASHSLVRIDRSGAPLKQLTGTTSTLQALQQRDGYLHAAADVTPAYRGNSAVQKVQRELVYIEPNVVVVYDRVQTAGDTTQTWQLAMPVAPSLSGATATVANAGHTLSVTRIGSTGGAMSVYDYRADADMKGGFRLDERLPGGDQRYLHVLSLDGAVTSAVASGASGVTLSLAGGGTATVSFQRDSVGATLTWGGQTTALGAGVDQLPAEAQ